MAGFFFGRFGQTFFFERFGQTLFRTFPRFSQGKPYFPCILDGLRAIFLRFSLGKRTFRWVFLGKTLFALHIGRFS